MWCFCVCIWSTLGKFWCFVVMALPITLSQYDVCLNKPHHDQMCRTPTLRASHTIFWWQKIHTHLSTVILNRNHWDPLQSENGEKLRQIRLELVWYNWMFSMHIFATLQQQQTLHMNSYWWEHNVQSIMNLCSSFWRHTFSLIKKLFPLLSLSSLAPPKLFDSEAGVKNIATKYRKKVPFL